MREENSTQPIHFARASVPALSLLLTDGDLAVDLLQHEASLVGELCSGGAQAAHQPVLPQLVVVQAELEELLEDVQHRVVPLQAAHVVKQHLRPNAPSNGQVRGHY